MPTAEDAVQVPPWRPEDGEPPAVWAWPGGTGPAVYVRTGGRWSLAPVNARFAYPDGRVAYQVVLAIPPQGGFERTYWWPQDGLRRAWGSSAEPQRTR